MALPCGAYGTIRGVEDRVGSHTCCSLLELLPAMLPAFLINDRFARFAIVQFPASRNGLTDLWLEEQWDIDPEHHAANPLFH